MSLGLNHQCFTIGRLVMGRQAVFAFIAGEWLDPGEYARWHLDGRAIKHDFGDLVL